MNNRRRSRFQGRAKTTWLCLITGARGLAQSPYSRVNALLPTQGPSLSPSFLSPHQNNQVEIWSLNVFQSWNFIHSFIQCLLSTFCMPGTMPGMGYALEPKRYLLCDNRKRHWKSKLQWDVTSHRSEWPSSKSLQIINNRESVEKREPSYSVGVNANWYSLENSMEFPSDSWACTWRKF